MTLDEEQYLQNRTNGHASSKCRQLILQVAAKDELLDKARRESCSKKGSGFEYVLRDHGTQRSGRGFKATEKLLQEGSEGKRNDQNSQCNSQVEEKPGSPIPTAAHELRKSHFAEAPNPSPGDEKPHPFESHHKQKESNQHPGMLRAFEGDRIERKGMNPPADDREEDKACQQENEIAGAGNTSAQPRGTSDS